MKEWCIQNKYSILFILLMFCIAYYITGRSYGFYFPADEFGYWSYAVRLAGYDWSEIASLGSYYSFGYSLILFPVFLVFKDGVAAYRAALTVNFALLAVCFCIFRKINTEEENSPFSLATAIFYPTWLFYAGTTFAEILLVTLYAMICLLFLEYFKTEKRCYATLAVVAMIYMYFVHMRAIGVLLSGIIVIFIYGMKSGRKISGYMITLILCTSLMLVAGYLLKQYWTDTVYGDVSDSLKNVNDYAGQLGKLAYIFTAEGIKNLIISVGGKLLYIGLASFGIAYFGIVYSFSRIMHMVRAGKPDRTGYFYLFVLISILAAIMICAIYTIRPGRVDSLAYGRYHEYVMPVLVITGIRALGEKGISVKKLLCSIFVFFILEAVMTGLITASLHENGQTSFFGNTICGISWLYNPEKFQPILFYWQAYFAGVVLTVIFCMLIWWTGRKKNREIFLIFLVAAEIAIGIRLSTMYIDSSRLGCFRDTNIVQKIFELNADGDREVYYSTNGNPFGNIGILQFMMRDTKINIVKQNYDLDEHDYNDLLLIDFDSSQSRVLEEMFEYCLTNGHFTLFYN